MCLMKECLELDEECYQQLVEGWSSDTGTWVCQSGYQNPGMEPYWSADKEKRVESNVGEAGCLFWSMWLKGRVLEDDLCRLE